MEKNTAMTSSQIWGTNVPMVFVAMMSMVLASTSLPEVGSTWKALPLVPQFISKKFIMVLRHAPSRVTAALTTVKEITARLFYIIIVFTMTLTDVSTTIIAAME